MAAYRSPTGMLALCVGWSIFSFSAHATDFTGAWASDPAVCNQVFAKSGSKISFAKDSDAYGSGLIIENNKISGKMATCAIQSRKEDGPLTQFILNCSTDIALGTVQFSVKIDSENKFTRVFSGMSGLSTPYFRCPK